MLVSFPRPRRAVKGDCSPNRLQWHVLRDRQGVMSGLRVLSMFPRLASDRPIDRLIEWPVIQFHFEGGSIQCSLSRPNHLWSSPVWPRRL